MTLPHATRREDTPEHTAPEALDPQRFRDALARFPSGVTVVTTRDQHGQPYGLTASAFTSVSLDPPLVSFCLAHSAACHPVFAGSDAFTVNVLAVQDTDLALRFARQGEDKFADKRMHGTREGAPTVADALAVLDCSVYARHPAGDHTILLGEVQQAQVRDGDPLVLWGKTFQRVTELAS
ncbi:MULTISPECIES: flavin reductase family protein [unclassified Actinopolyspora]|uniref:flavin reductase family protein n=1 Tax=unclassified Actinopolyspora TaxID=2639451 RepID=UPI0013F5B7A2|nr:MULTISPECIES: flavin reductase family protein [unclassified Actinopolyspora]NHD19344.1 flavin reductase family protein [Actinopolyspora sp. BKK2]NHE78468.1 flavin reductase family protein [Actinopolyspora sp. BKK1]